MSKFYVVGITKYDPASEEFDLILKLEEYGTLDGDLRLRIPESELATWTAKIGTYSESFTITFA